VLTEERVQSFLEGDGLTVDDGEVEGGLSDVREVSEERRAWTGARS
jgi:hypothetical protein